jgi:hypothetical protein
LSQNAKLEAEMSSDDSLKEMVVSMQPVQNNRSETDKIQNMAAIHNAKT